MDKLKLLWELEEHNVNLKRNLNKIESLNKKIEDKNVEAKIKKVNRKLEILKNNKEVIKTCISKYENSLKQYEYEIASLNDKLYKENITDIKQLEYLSYEKEQFKNKLKEVETNMIAYMEEEEMIDKKNDEALILLEELGKDSTEHFSIVEEELKTLEKKLKEETDKIKEISKKIDDDILKEYNSLNDRKSKPIVLIVDEMCTGCNMKLPKYQIEELKVKGKIINCESCGRILYLRD